MYKQGEMHFGIKVIRKISGYYYEVQRMQGNPYQVFIGNLTNHYRRHTLDVPRRVVPVSLARRASILAVANSTHPASSAESTLCIKLGWDLNEQNLSEIYTTMKDHSSWTRLPNAVWYRIRLQKIPAYLSDPSEVEKTPPEGMVYPNLPTRRRRYNVAVKPRRIAETPRGHVTTRETVHGESVPSSETSAPVEPMSSVDPGVPLLDLIDRRIAEQLRIATEAKAKAEILSSKGEEARKRVTIHRAKVKKVIGDLRIELGGIERKIMEKAEPRILADTLGESFSLRASGEDAMEVALDHVQKLIILSNGEA